MNFRIFRLLSRWCMGIAVVCCAVGANGQVIFPHDHRTMNRPVTYPEMLQFLQDLPKRNFIKVTEEGSSVQGRKLMLVNLNRGGNRTKFKVFYFAQQHGDEVSGKDALLVLVRDIARNPALLPEDVDLYVMPMVNPDGAEAGTRLNAAGADLNRDHLLLSQPETRVLHQVARRIRPHLVADGHEFGKDSNYLSSKGLNAWPDITMDAASHPMLPIYLRDAGVKTISRLNGALDRAGHAYRRYLVGGPPPAEEMRPSTPEADDARNTMGSLGALSFIIEAGVNRKKPDPQLDLGRRVDAYLVLLRHLWGTPVWRAQTRRLVERARLEPLPPFIPTNTFWGNVDGTVSIVKFREASSQRVLEIPTLQLMTDLVIKGGVFTPKGYAIEASAAPLFVDLLQRHGIRFEPITTSKGVQAERTILIRVEKDFDNTYQRYENRHIVRHEPVATLTLLPGTVWVPVNQELALRTILLLEPGLMYGMYVYPGFEQFASMGEPLPVIRVF